MLEDYFRFAAKSIINRKLRSWLTMIGIFIGIASVVALISVGQGMEVAINEQFEQLGSDKVIVSPVGFGPLGAFAGNPLTDQDLKAVEETVGVDKAAGFFYRNGIVKFSDETANILVIGLPTDDSAEVITSMSGFEAEKGRDLRDGDTKKVTVGWRFWTGDIYEKEVSLRDKLEIEGEKFQVVGLMKKVGNPQDDAQIYIPIDVARELFGVDEISSIFVQVKKGYVPSKVAEDIEEELRDERGEEEDEETFQVQTFEQLLEQIGIVLLIMRVVLVGIAAISLVVGGIGIMNTMYTSVIERTREIGIMKAIGATNSNVLLVFLVESGIYGLVGGLIGVLVGVSISVFIQKIAASFIGSGLFKVYISPTLIIGALLFSFVIGAISGVFPARQASKMKPVDALRYE